MTQFELSENLDSPAPYYCGLRASDIGACLYKIRDDSIRPRHFLGANNADEIEAILLDREGHSLHKFIDGVTVPEAFFNSDKKLHTSLKQFGIKQQEIIDSLLI
ncbi:hypothetical protein C2G38_2172797 [Gigaspora rosea]|uniref:Uncharacterized protein n=1 Tax=Gigaspora rosea TaxID=44941 RepID=A0A397VSF1_9GLOM|nr:hypothetical protein C2G38_2172797 [Gigaspora rosea]